MHSVILIVAGKLSIRLKPCSSFSCSTERSASVARSCMSWVMRARGTSWAPFDMACEMASHTWYSQAVSSLAERPCITAARAPMERFTSEEISRTFTSNPRKPEVKAIASWCTP